MDYGGYDKVKIDTLRQIRSLAPLLWPEALSGLNLHRSFELLIGFSTAEAGNGGKVWLSSNCGFLGSTASSCKAFLKGRGEEIATCATSAWKMGKRMPSGGPKL